MSRGGGRGRRRCRDNGRIDLAAECFLRHHAFCHTKRPAIEAIKRTNRRAGNRRQYAF